LIFMPCRLPGEAKDVDALRLIPSQASDHALPKRTGKKKKNKKKHKKKKKKKQEQPHKTPKKKTKVIDQTFFQGGHAGF